MSDCIGDKNVTIKGLSAQCYCFDSVSLPQTSLMIFIGLHADDYVTIRACQVFCFDSAAAYKLLPDSIFIELWYCINTS